MCFSERKHRRISKQIWKSLIRETCKWSGYFEYFSHISTIFIFSVEILFVKCVRKQAHLSALHLFNSSSLKMFCTGWPKSNATHNWTFEDYQILFSSQFQLENYACIFTELFFMIQYYFVNLIPFCTCFPFSWIQN